MTEGRTVRREDCRAPEGQFRLVCWKMHQGRVLECYIDADFPDRKAAAERADAISVPDVLIPAVYDSRGKVVHNAARTNKPDFKRPTSVTRLAGFKDPLERTGSYKRR